jgi:hypothetical protein
MAVTNQVRIRNRENPEDVVVSIPGRVPYMPIGFPAGIWKVGKPIAKTNPYLAPYFIPTNAWQMVTEWTLEPDGSYGQPTARKIKDEGYGIHFSTSSTTLGCLKIVNKSELLTLVRMIVECKEAITFEVVG